MVVYLPGGISFWSKLTLGLAFFSFQASLQASPLPVKTNKSTNTNIIDHLGRLTIITFCKSQHLGYHHENRSERQEIIANDAHQSAMLLLYEFATCSGPEKSYWNSRHPYTQQFKEGEGIKYLCEQFFKLQTDTNLMLGIDDIRYQMSATVIPFRPKTWYFAVEQNIKLLKKKNYAQFILGSFNARIDVLSEDRIRITVKNRMSRKSLFIGLGPRVKRPKALGTTYQIISIILTLEEARQFASQ